MEINKIYNENCFNTFKRIPDKSIDLVLTDPPYGVTACQWDIVPDLDRLWIELKRIGKDNCAYVFTASQPFITDLINSNRKWFKYEWIWSKGYGGCAGLAKFRPMPAHESILVFADGKIQYTPQMRVGLPYKDMSTRPIKTDRGYGIKKRIPVINKGTRFPLSVIEYNSQLAECNNVHKLHPSQKPVALFEYLIKTYTHESDIVLDPFIGSGTTAVACIRTNCHYIGSEINKDYYDIAIKRIEGVLQRK